MLFPIQETLAGQTHQGKFLVQSETDLLGYFELSGCLDLEDAKHPRLRLYNQDQTPWIGMTNLPSTITGELSDGTKVSMFDCSMLGFEQPIAPNFVIGGAHHLQSDDNSIVAITFAVNDTPFLQWGDIFKVPSLERQDENSSLNNGDSIVALFEIPTALGHVSIQYHRKASSLPLDLSDRPESDSLGHVVVLLTFPVSNSLDSAWESARKILYFLGVISGGPVEMAQAAIFAEVAPSSPLEILPLHYYLRFYGALSSNIELGPIVKDRNSIENLFEKWISLGEGSEEPGKLWEARRRYCTSCLTKVQFTDPDRLISAANLFDLLPDFKTYTEVQLQPEFRDAVETTRCIFRKLPKADDCYLTRQRGLDALANLKRPTLKTKVRTRAQIVIEHFAPNFDRIVEITNRAVDLRNRYVHGNNDRKEPSLCELVLCAKTLEFIFVVADLLESGWDVQQFREQWELFTFVHVYLHRYNEYVNQAERA